MPYEHTKREQQTILIVDDEAVNIKILHESLHKDYQVIFSTQGDRAIELAISKKPDLIILDIIMPEMDGYAVCKALKQNPETRDILIIFITVKDHSDDETMGFELGAVDYITKPINPSVVKARVRTHLALMLARRELEIKNRELLEAASLREDIDAISRHDLKTPLNGIINLPQLIAEDGPLNAQQREFLDIIENSGYQMLNIVNMSLNLCKMERGNYSYTPQYVNIIQIIRKIQSEMKNVLEIKSLSCSVFIEGRPPYIFEKFIVHGEEFLLYSMMANLIKNAFEASPEGETITIHLNHTAMDLIRIHNTGAVPENIRNDFFEKYSTYGKETGMGLGTYSARLIAQIHQGTIELETDDIKGTNIIVQLPKYTENLDIDTPVRVLIVEDSATERLFIENILSGTKEIEVIGTASCGTEAIKKIRKLKPDLITMDIILPDMTGIDITNEMMKTDPTPIVFVSAFTDEESTRMAFEAMKFGGILDIMAKPYRSEDWKKGSWGKDLVLKIISLAQVNRGRN
ncbi:MAG: response regulator [Candidatus Magnetomorum sp.]|nr:response regulator [Candidatus Magnetomorum sp.]